MGSGHVRREHPLPQIVEDHDRDRPAQPLKRLLAQLGPAPGARCEGQQVDALAAIAEQDGQPRPAVLAGVSGGRTIGPSPIINLALFPGGGYDHGVRLGRPLAPQRDGKTADAGVLGGEAVIVDEIAPDCHGVAATAQGRLDQLAIRLTGAGGGRAPRRGRRAQRAGDPGRMGPESVDTSMAGFAAG